MAANSGSTMCAPAELRQCPCVGTSQTGTQTCDASGTRYETCTGCPPLQSAAGATGGAAGSVATTLGNAGNAGNRATSTGLDAGLSESNDDAGPMLDVGNAAPGVWCGVGLPALCDPKTQKCCARSISVDSCIGMSETCKCDLEDCDVLEARCDGPEDCPTGQVCCGTLESDQQVGTRYTSFMCAAQCSLMQNKPEACHTSEHTCPSGLVCANSQILANVQICIDPQSIEQ
jgi:hypothetical protein